MFPLLVFFSLTQRQAWMFHYTCRYTLVASGAVLNVVLFCLWLGGVNSNLPLAFSPVGIVTVFLAKAMAK
jgi:hypothetical protein